METDIETELSYKYLLDVFNQVYIRMRLREIQQLQSPKRKLSEKRRALKKLELQKQRITFLRDVARVNRELIQRTLEQVE